MSNSASAVTRLPTFRHEALFYAGDDEFLQGTVPFILEGLAQHEPVLVVVSEPKIAQELTMTSFTDEIRSRGMTPGSRTLDLEACRRARGWAGSSTCRRPSPSSSPGGSGSPTAKGWQSRRCTCASR